MAPTLVESVLGILRLRRARVKKGAEGMRMKAPVSPLVTRRHALQALAGTAAILPRAAGQYGPRRTVAVVGGGMAGATLAWLLDGHKDVVLIESRPVVGGNVETVQLTAEGQAFAVDAGAQYFHPTLYRSYVRLLFLL